MGHSLPKQAHTPRAFRRLLLGLGLGLLMTALASCGDGSEDADDAATPATSSASSTETSPDDTTPAESDSHELTGTFSGDVLPIIEQSCARCHTGDGPGTNHVRMDTVADVVANADLIFAAVDTGFMPPWPASNESIAFQDNWNISDDERDRIVQWASFDPQIDIDPATPIVANAGVRGLEQTDLVVSAVGSYDGEQYQPDEYRCFIYDPGFTDTTWVTGYDFRPDQAEVVHHLIGYLASADDRTRAEELDAADTDQGGWSCFGGSGTGDTGIFLGWAPGQGPTQLPDGSGMAMEAGDFFILQIHYHYEVEAPADHSTLELQIAEASAGQLDQIQVVPFLAPAEIPCRSSESGPLCDRDTALASAIEKYGEQGVRADETLFFCGKTVADFAEMTDGTASSTCDLPMRASGEIVSVLGHEHELGASFRMTLNPGQPNEQVLLDIPDWRFDWQLNYYPLETIEVQPRDIVRIECAWDLDRRDPELDPAYIVWADGTDDEMCFATVTIRETN
jgi:hypothetical protein